MRSTEEDVKDLLFAVPDPHGLMDVLAPQEIDRLASLVLSVLTDTDVPYEQWQPRVKQTLTDALLEDKQMFGNLDLAHMLKIDELLKQIYDFDTAAFRKAQT